MTATRFLVLATTSLTLLQFSVKATPYASGVTNNSGTISFILNEAVDNVKVTFNNNTSTNDLGALGSGTHSFSLGASTNFQILVSKASLPGFVRPTGTTITTSQITNSAGTQVPHPHGTVRQISSDTNILLNFYAPRGLTVNRDPKTSLFGRTYVANAAAGTTSSNGISRPMGDGIYVLNADGSDALGQGNTELNGGIAFVASTSSPWRLTVGQDNNLYICDWTDTVGSLYVTDPNVSPGSGFNVLAGPVGAPFPVTSSRYHGSVHAAIVTGSLAATNLVAYILDEDLQDNRDTTSATQRNSLWQHNIGGALPGPEVMPTRRFTPSGQVGIANAAPVWDMDRGASGHFYLVCNRQTHDTSGLIVRTSTGGTAWNSRQTSTNMTGGANDIMFDTHAVAVSADQKYVAVLRRDARTWIVPLTNNMPDLGRRLWLASFPAQTTAGRVVRFDAAGNLYVVNNVSELVRVFSPGGTTLAVTGGDVSGTNGTFRLVTAPVIRDQPTNYTTYAGTTASFTVFIEGMGTTPSYQWKLNGTNISGATASTYTRANVQQTNAGIYTVTISNELAVVTSNDALLTVNDGLPVFITEATNRTVDAGLNTTFTAATTGTDPRTYQWQLNGVDIAGATGVTYTRANVQQPVAGDYSLIASNSFGSVTSVVATLTVTDLGPVFTTSLFDTNRNAGQSFTWNTVTKGTDPRTYQWYYNNVEIPDGTNASYTFPNPQKLLHEGSYSVTVTHPTLGSASTSATLTIVDTAPAVVTQPANVTVNETSNAVFSVVSRGTDPRLYQWQMNGIDISGATDTSYTLVNASRTQHSNTFTVVITNDYGSVTSAVRTLTVNFPPEITTQPVSQAVDAGTNVTFSVEAIGNSLKYQWLFNGGNISGATTSTYTKSNVQSADGGDYSVVVTNTAGTITSATALLTVNSTVVDPPLIGIVGANGDVTLTWSAVAGRTYRVQYKAALTDANWTDLVPDVVAGGNSASKNDNLGAASQRYYRVVLLP